MSSNTIKRKSGPPISIAEHTLVSTQPDETIFRIFFLNTITTLLLQAATTQHADNPITRGAALQRAAQFNQSALQTVRELLADAPDEWRQFLDILEDHIIEILEQLITAMDARPEPPAFIPDPQLHIPPPMSINDPEPLPNYYWQWIQPILQAQQVLEAISSFSHNTNDMPGADTSVSEHATLSTINHIVASFQAHIDLLPPTPQDFHAINTDATSPEQLLAHGRQALVDAQAELIEQAASHHHRSQTIVAPELHQHADVIQRITDTPLLPGTVRTVIVSPEHPAGPASIVAYSTNREIHIHSVAGNFHPDLDAQNRLYITAAYMTHLSDDHADGHPTTAGSMRDAAYAISSLLGGFQQLDSAGIHHIVSTGASRGIDPHLMLQIFQSICGPASQSIHRLLADTELASHWCNHSEAQSLIDAAVKAGAGLHILHNLVNHLNHDPNDFGLPPLTLPQPTVDAIISAATTAGVNPRNIEQFTENATSGRTPYGFPHRFRTVPEATLFDQPYSQREIGTCSCTTCHTFPSDRYQHPQATVIRLEAFAHATRELSAESLHIFQQITDEPHRCALAAYNCISTDRLAHFLLLNQPYPQHPHLQRLSFIDQSYREVKQQWQSAASLFSEETTKKVNTDPNTLAIVAELDIRYILHAMSYHSREFYALYNNITEQAYHLANASNLVELATNSLNNLTHQLPNHERIPAVEDYYQQAVAIRESIAATFNQIVPTEITPNAQIHPAEIHNLRSIPIDANLTGFHGIPDVSQTQIADIICRYVHNGRVHIKMFDEPYTAQYPQLRAINDVVQIRTIENNPQVKASDLSQRAANIVAAISNGNHCVPTEAWLKLTDNARQLDLSNTAVDSTISELRGYQHRQDPAHSQILLAADSAVHDAILDTAHTLGFTQAQVNQIAAALNRDDWVTQLPKLPTRHIKAILRAAQHTRLEPHAIDRIKEAINV